MTAQTRAMSFVEAMVNVVAGYVIAVLTQVAVLPLFGVRLSLGNNLLVGAIFTVASIARSYLLRRVFESMHRRYVDHHAS